MIYNKQLLKFTARVLLITLGSQLILPAASFALTSGPTQPEVQSFEPVGTTDMVDLFTGDFVYNIPLLNIEGYPVNIAYHSGSNMEQEASWVGLGWNINPGEINRSIRGIPDDFDGETVQKTLSMKDEKNIRVGLGVGAEFAGVGPPILNLSLDLNASMNISNYRGVSADFSTHAGVDVLGMVSAGIDMGVGSQSGADVGYNLGLSFNSSMIAGSDIAAGVGFSMSQGYNTRTGVQARNFGISTNVSLGGKSINGPSFSCSVPIGIQNIVPVITNATTMKVYRGQIKLGGELYSIYGHLAVYGMISDLHYVPTGDKPAYGYLYAQNANESSIMDFTRDKDGMFNETKPFLPAGNMTYDVYSVNGQGTGGSFRPFRNDFGSVYDPAVSSPGDKTDLNIEAGYGDLFELGDDKTVSHTTATSGPWPEYKRRFTSKQDGSIYENVYFKKAGEATVVNQDYLNTLQGISPITGTAAQSLPEKKPGSTRQRDPRANLIYYFTGAQAVKYGVASSTQLYSYNSTNGFADGPDASKTAIPRIGGSRSAHQISEIVQVQTDGRKYIYGLPAMNNTKTEATFSVAPHSSPDGLITYNSSDASTSNSNGRANFYSATITPPYAHSYLLTDVVSADYVDITGDGPTDDDFGSYTKFNYSLKNSHYGWKAPYGQNIAQYDKGFKSDPMDDKASFISGDREQWYLHSIETKNDVAEFYTSPRLDGRGVDTGQDISFKLDSIKLYNKHDRFINQTNAVPLKTVIFQYSDSLCKGIPNTVGTGSNSGKLTLDRIYVRYGNSDKNMISPYQFTYEHNYPYKNAYKDRWGAYKPPSQGMTNADFPFVDQNESSDSLNAHASAWALSNIQLPSGGAINIQYEADDYAYVQDKPAMEMFKLAGIGNSSNFSGGSQLYFDKNTPNLYFYFTRRTSAEKAGVSFKDNYLKGQELLYYNLDTRLTSGAYEPIKGYAKIVDVGACSDNVHGYIKVEPVTPEGGGAHLNPATYTAINFARYYLPQVVFPGNNPYSSNIQNVLAGLKYSFHELLNFGKNPVKRMVQEGKAKGVDISQSFIRLNSPGLKKRGGGSRVKQLTFYDNWSQLAGGNAQNASYGKTYDYTRDDQGSYGTISSGVASYEPQIGGDENPFRLPVNYSVQSGSHWPPNDPVGVYQELPVGESLYPAPVVGYSRVTVKSIHQEEGKSSQGEDIHDFYTAKDFPIITKVTALQQLENEKHYSFTEQERIFKGTQGYTLIFNDMHGKPKRVEHRILKPPTGNSELVSYTQYIYNTSGNKLSNDVPVIEYDPVAGKLQKVTRKVAYEEDLTIDSREKKEVTDSRTKYKNLNAFLIPMIPFFVPIPYWYHHDFSFTNQFDAVVATKVVQQYGILKTVQNYKDGALTTLHNEAFDPVTGKALITSINNEFRDTEFSVQYPAYWGYKSMGPSYVNTQYAEDFDSVKISDYEGELPTGPTVAHYQVGDELSIDYTFNGNAYSNNVWVTGFKPPDTIVSCNSMTTLDPNYGYNVNDTITYNYNVHDFPHVLIKPRFKYQSSWPGNGALTNAHIEIIRSGSKNQLDQTVLSYKGMETPFDDSNYLKDSLHQLISLSGSTYSDTLTAILPKYDSLLHPTTFDSLNEFVNGTREIKRLDQEYAYMKKRTYDTNETRTAGLFDAVSLWHNGPPLFASLVQNDYCWQYCGTDPDPMAIQQTSSANTPNAISNSIIVPEAILCIDIIHYIGGIPNTGSLLNSFLSLKPEDDPNWVVARTVTKYSPWGYELENKDAIGNYTTAQYGYNNQLPVSLAKNAQQQEVFSESFEDYQLLQVLNNMATMAFTPFVGYFPVNVVVGNFYRRFNLNGSGNFQIMAQQAHTGNWSLATPSGASVTLKASDQPVSTGQPEFLPFTLQTGKAYVVSYWFRPKSPAANATGYSCPANVQLKSNIINGWQQAQGEITVSPGNTTYTFDLPDNAYVDDIRIFPADANMKAFVYDPVNQRLMATLDENNFATFYEYNQEGNLVRTKKETEKGIMTVMESRSANPKTSDN